jgi:hypothetical protein
MNECFNTAKSNQIALKQVGFHPTPEDANSLCLSQFAKKLLPLRLQAIPGDRQEAFVPGPQRIALGHRMGGALKCTLSLSLSGSL